MTTGETTAGGERREPTPLELAEHSYLKKFDSGRGIQFGEGPRATTLTTERQKEERRQAVAFVGRRTLERILEAAQKAGLDEEKQQELVETLPALYDFTRISDEHARSSFLRAPSLRGIDPKLRAVVFREMARARLLDGMTYDSGGGRNMQISLGFYEKAIAQADDVVKGMGGVDEEDERDAQAQVRFDWEKSADPGLVDRMYKQDPELFADLVVAASSTSLSYMGRGDDFNERLQNILRQGQLNEWFTRGAQVDSASGLAFRPGHKKEDLAAMRKSLETFGKAGKERFETPAEVAEEKQRLERDVTNLSERLRGATGDKAKTQEELDAARARLKALEIQGADTEAHLEGAYGGVKDYEADAGALRARDEQLTALLQGALESPGLTGGKLKEAVRQALEKLQGGGK